MRSGCVAADRIGVHSHVTQYEPTDADASRACRRLRLPRPCAERGVTRLVLIRFGLHCDGMQPPRAASAFGEITLGPLGLLDVLETQLGLPPSLATSADALMAYRACLAECDRESRFYHASFALDPINVGRTLLEWRAQLHEHGWDGTFAAGAPPRLRDVADVERLAASRVPLDRGQRARRIAMALDALSAPIERIELLDDVRELPAAWRRLLDRLGAVPGAARATPQGAQNTDLHTLQMRLNGESPHVSGRAVLRGDGSVVVLRGASRDITAQTVAEMLRAAPMESLLLAERDGVVLDNALERSGLPRAGFQHHSRFRAVTQVLKLALSLLWRPVSPNLLLQFLIHPTGPLPRHVRDELADAVAERPGIGGPRWRDALQRIESRMRDTFGADAKEIDATLRAIEEWLGGPRYDPSLGAPLAALTRRTQLCSTYSAIQLNASHDDAQRSLHANALAQSEALLRALRSLADQGQTHVRRIELDRLIDEVSSVAPDPNSFAQAHHALAVTDPANVTRSWRRIFWWDLAPPSRDVGYPWSRKEFAWLQANGVELFDVDAVLGARSRQWLQPVMNATECLVLVVHDSERGYHPLWTQIDGSFDGLLQLRPDAALLNGDTLEAAGVPTRTVAVQPLAAPRRWWQLPREVRIPRREVESYSSLAKLIDWPHGYVLRYAARLRAGRAQDLADGNRLYGNLAHRLLERYFNDNPLWAMLDAQGLREWFAGELPQLIESEAAVLLEPGRGVDKQRVTTTLERALVALVEHLRGADIVAVQPELHAEAAFKSLRVGGDIDLLLTDPRGREIVLDVKWGGESFRAAELRDNRQLQLATYSYLRRAGKRWPEQALFIVESGHLLAKTADVFPSAVECGGSRDETVESLWQRVGRSYDWRWRQRRRRNDRNQYAGYRTQRRIGAAARRARTIGRPRSVRRLREPARLVGPSVNVR